MSGRVAVVVGATSGIGLATALELAARGDRLVLAARSPESLADARTQCLAAGAAEVHAVETDVAESAAVEGLVQTAVTECGRVDLVVHTATTMAYGPIEKVPAEIFESVVDDAVHGTANLARVVVPLFRQQGAGVFVIVNSLLGSVTVPNMGAYATAKWGQRAIARTLQQEVRDAPGVHVCIVSPGSINTPIYYQAANFMGRSARPPVPVLQPERAARAIAALADRPRNHVSVPVGPGNPIVITGFRLLPFVYDRLVGPLFRLAAMTGGPVGADQGSVLAPRPARDRVHGRWPDPAPTA